MTTTQSGPVWSWPAVTLLGQVPQVFRVVSAAGERAEEQPAGHKPLPPVWPSLRWQTYGQHQGNKPLSSHVLELPRRVAVLFSSLCLWKCNVQIVPDKWCLFCGNVQDFLLSQSFSLAHIYHPPPHCCATPNGRKCPSPACGLSVAFRYC